MSKSKTGRRARLWLLSAVVLFLAQTVRVPPAFAQTTAPTAAPLTSHGVTLYGTVDVGLAYLTHGAPLSALYGPGLPFLIQKNSNRPITSLASNGLSQSKIGLVGAWPLNSDLSAVARVETAFLPTSLRLSDGPGSLVHDNGRAPADQITSGDSSRAGQWDTQAGYVGLASKRLGILTFGRQTGLINDDIARYDPQFQAQAFSPIGYSGVAGGGGDTEDGRLEPSLKYAEALGPVRIGLLHQFRGPGGSPGGADQASVGLELGALSLDAIYSRIDGAVAAVSLTPAQNALAPGTLSATISDNTAASLQGRYSLGKARIYAGYEQIRYANPDHPLAAGASGLAGYRLRFVNDSAYAHHRELAIAWTGLRYAFTPAWEVSLAYYRYDQNSYRGDGCADRSAATCRGDLNAMSAVVTHRLDKHFDLYAGLNYSHVADGLASGYLQTTAMGPMTGVRLNF